MPCCCGCVCHPVVIRAVWHSFTLCGVCDGSGHELDFDVQGCFQTTECSLNECENYVGGGSQCSDGMGGFTNCIPCISVDYSTNFDCTFNVSLTISIRGCDGCCDLSYTLTRTNQSYSHTFIEFSDTVTQDPDCDLNSTFTVSVDFSETDPGCNFDFDIIACPCP